MLTSDVSKNGPRGAAWGVGADGAAAAGAGVVASYTGTSITFADATGRVDATACDTRERATLVSSATDVTSRAFAAFFATATGGGVETGSATVSVGAAGVRCA